MSVRTSASVENEGLIETSRKQTIDLHELVCTSPNELIHAINLVQNISNILKCNRHKLLSL